MNALYECEIMHCRLKPKRNAFRYRFFMMSLDLAELTKTEKSISGFSHNRFNLFSLHDSDYVSLEENRSIRENVILWLKSQSIDCPDDARISLVAFPRALGYGFNPASFFFVESSSGHHIATIVQVVNTFREMKLYPIQALGKDGLSRGKMPKNLYVSPFSDPGAMFDFVIGQPGDKWRANIDVYGENERILISSIRGKRRDLTSARLLWYAIKYPLLSVKIIGLIHWHAFLLWMRGVPFFRKTERREAQLEVMRPHSSLK